MRYISSDRLGVGERGEWTREERDWYNTDPTFQQIPVTWHPGYYLVLFIEIVQYWNHPNGKIQAQHLFIV